MHLLILTVALIASLGLPAETAIACCYPDKMEGIKNTLERSLIQYFAADYALGYIYETKDPTSDVARIFDLINSKVYEVKGEECRSKDLRSLGLFDPCVHTEDVSTESVLMGGGADVIDVATYKYKVDTIDVFKVVRPEAEQCFPVASQSKVGRVTATSLYFEVNAEINHPDPFGALAKCGVEVRTHDENQNGGEEEEEKEEEEEEEEEEEAHGGSSESEEED